MKKNQDIINAIEQQDLIEFHRLLTESAKRRLAHDYFSEYMLNEDSFYKLRDEKLYELFMKISIFYNDIEAIKYLTEKGVIIPEHQDENLLSCAIRFNCYETFRFVVEYFKKNSWKLTPKIDFYNILQYAARHGQKNIVEILIKEGFDPNEPNDASEISYNLKDFCWNECFDYAIEDAAFKGHFDVFELLYEYLPPKSNIFSKKEYTFPRIAAFSGNIDILNFLIDHDIDVHEQDNSGIYPINQAAYEGHFDAFKLLFEYLKDNSKEIPQNLAHIAAKSKKNNAAILNYLTE